MSIWEEIHKYVSYMDKTDAAEQIARIMRRIISLREPLGSLQNSKIKEAVAKVYTAKMPPVLSGMQMHIELNKGKMRITQDPIQHPRKWMESQPERQKQEDYEQSLMQGLILWEKESNLVTLESLSSILPKSFIPHEIKRYL